jgi:hypothetical protein
MLDHPQTKALGLLQEVPGSSIPLLGLPIRFDGHRPQPRSCSPALGEMNSSDDAPADTPADAPAGTVESGRTLP